VASLITAQLWSSPLSALETTEATKLVGAEVALAEPWELEAVTWTRIVE
jgi:hypothetical protein